ncbi:hypothetical protein T06_17030 [Trichinella sp. T6]|nr:hypothetical protein T06_17030 [Trichinella sp. T6]
MTSRIFNARGILFWTVFQCESSDSQAEVPVSFMGRFAPHREMCKIRRNVQPEIDARM